MTGLEEEEKGHRRRRLVERKWACEGKEMKKWRAKRQPNVEAGNLKTCSGSFDLCHVGSGAFVCRR